MKRALEIVIFFSIFSLAFLPGNVSGQTSPCSDIEPPFISAGPKPNILIILDNSGSIDEDFSGNTVGAYSSQSKSFIGRNALMKVITQLETKANIGLMTFNLLPTTVDEGNVGYSGDGSGSAYGYYSLTSQIWPTPLCMNSSGSPDPYYRSCSSSGNCYSSYPNCIEESQGYLRIPVGDVNPADSSNNYATFQTQLATSSPVSSESYKDYYLGYCGIPGNNYYNYYGGGSTYYEDENTCPYIINSGGTPTAGAMQAALQYFNGTFVQPGQSSTQDSPITYPCQKNFIILVTDGVPTSELNGTYVGSASSTIMAQVTAGLEELDGVLEANSSKVSTTVSGTTYSATPSLQNTIYSWQNVTPTVNGTQTSSSSPFVVPTFVLGLGSDVTAQSHLADLDLMAQAGGTNQAYLATDSSALTTALQSILSNILSSVASGSSVSTIATSNQDGDNMLQAVFYPEKTFTAASGSTTSISWPGYLYNWWYATEEPMYCATVTLTNGVKTTSFTTQSCESTACPTGQTCLPEMFTSMREANGGATTYSTSPDYTLDLINDYILDSSFDSTTGVLTTNLYKDTDGTGQTLSSEGSTSSMDSLTPLWEAGKKLWETQPSDRTIYTYVGGTTSNGYPALVPFNTTNVTSSFLGTPANFDTCLQGSSSSDTLANLIDYVSGTDLNNSFCQDESTQAFESPALPCTSSCSSSTYSSCVQDSCRNRTIGLCAESASGPFSNTACSSSADCSGTYSQCVKNTWKLGDIDYSTPQVQANYKYCASVSSSGSFTYTSTPCTQDSDCSNAGLTGDACEPYESLVFVGANDGMLHAFQSGELSTQDATSTDIAKLAGLPTTSEGQELWSFIPENVLPYLRCLATNSCHLYYNDLTPYITTMYTDNYYCASVGSNNAVTYSSTSCTPATGCSGGETCMSEGTTAHRVLIGGLRLGGGADGNYCASSAGVSSGWACSTSSDCTTSYCVNSSGETNGQVCSSSSPCTATSEYSTCTAFSSCDFTSNVPSDTCASPASGDVGNGYTTGYDPSSCIGLSSYYAIDITDPAQPQLLWEFSDPLMGYSYSGPAVIHKWQPGTDKSGDQYDVMFLSGPTDPYDGSSALPLRAFVLKLDPQKLTIDKVYQTTFDNTSATQNAFGGRLFTTGVDVDGDGYTDYVLFGYTASNTSKTSWGGGIGLVYTDATTTDSSNNTVIDTTDGLNPQDWKYDVNTFANIPSVPITAQVATESCFNQTYLYTGTGRYFFAADNYNSSANSSLNFLMGIPFTCDALYQNCGSPSVSSVNSSSATVCTNLGNGDYAGAGWMYNLSSGSTPTYCANLSPNGSISFPSSLTSCTSNADCDSSQECVPKNGSLAERVITNPTTDPGTNAIYFTSSQPTTDPCSYGGQSAEWGLNCATGGPISDQSCSGYQASSTAADLYLQTSTGAVYNITTANAGNTTSSSGNSSTLSLNNSSNSGRSTKYVTGMAPESAVPITNLPAESGQLLQWMEQ